MSIKKISRQELEKLDTVALKDLALSIGIKYNDDISVPQLLKSIIDSGKIQIMNGKKVKMHPTFGEYIKIEVIPLSSTDRDNTIQIGINSYSIDIIPNTVVEIPILVAKFIAGCFTDKHIYDPNERGPDGKMGKHTTEPVFKYVVKGLPVE